MSFINYSYKSSLAVLLLLCMLSCEKKEIDFGGSALSDDPNIVAVDTISVNAFTTQVDSFSTLTTGYFVAGNYYDSAFGSFQSTAYFDLTTPYDSTGTLNGCTSCYFDSLVAITKFSGGYYGDTTKPFNLNINRLTHPIADNSFGYNINAVSYNPTPLGNFSGVISPSKQSTIRIRMSDDFGKDIFNKIQRHSDTILLSDNFLDYIKGFCFTANASANNVVYYMQPPGDSLFVLMYYHKNAPLPVSYIVKLPLNTAHQFNGYATDYSGTALSVFTQKKAQTFSSSQTNGYVYLNSNQGLYPKLNFPSLNSLKEINSYINVLSATLEIYPLKGSYGSSSLYKLPSALNLYVLDEYNNTQGYITDSTSSSLQTGNLYIDYLYNENTKYTFDITSYVNSILNGSNYFLFLQPVSGSSAADEQRLVLQALNNSGFKLKLNVLGL